MKKMIWALIFGAIAVLPAHAEDLAIPAASGNDAADSAKIEQYMEQAVDKQLAAMRSSLPMKVSAGVVWKRIYFGLGYDIGCLNLVKESDGEGTMRNNCFTISVGYNF